MFLEYLNVRIIKKWKMVQTEAYEVSVDMVTYYFQVGGSFFVRL